MTDIETFIKSKIRLLDNISGFHFVSTIEVVFSYSVEEPCQYINIEGKDIFLFSLLYVGVSEKMVLQSIHHVYAHLLSWHIYGYKDGHGGMYQRCCKMIGYEYLPISE